MADDPAKPRRLTVYAEAAAVLALVVAVVGVIVAVLAFDHDKEVAAGNPGATPVVTVTQYAPRSGDQNPKDADSSSPGFWSVTGVAILTMVTGLIAGFLVFLSWEKLVSDFGAVFLMVVIAGAHAFTLSLLGITVVWAVILAFVFAAIGFFANVFAA
ncbi:hypothetical protein ACIBG4_39660 [Nonomuraea sp. NPDC050383]|uniref:hypothetical protein n=1 Tax=Nonomuraea sp. NPDC050383 TaxID=3364362 RepID=UPI0037924CF5